MDSNQITELENLKAQIQQLKSINESFAKSILRLGNECREMEKEIKRLRSL